MGTGTLDLVDRLAEVAQHQGATIVGGPNTGDMFRCLDGRFRRLHQVVADPHRREGRVPVVVSTDGSVCLDDGEPPVRLPGRDTSPGAAVAGLRRRLARTDRATTLIVDHADLLLPAAAGGHLESDQSLLLETLAAFPVDRCLAPHRLVVIDRAGGLDPRLARQPGFREVRCELPDEAHRREFLRRLESMWDGSAFEPGVGLDHMARSAGGLTCDDVLREAVRASRNGEPLRRRWVQETKVLALRRSAGDGLVVHPPGDGMAGVAGLPQVRLWVQDRVASGDWPASILLGGPPGVGKTLVVRAIADAAGWPAVTLGRIRSMYVGESESNMSGVLSSLTALAPVVVHIDEADLAFGRRTGGPSADGGTSERLHASLLQYMGDADPERQVLFVLTTNRPHELDSATRSRAETLPILHPTPGEAAQILKLECARRGHPVDEVTAQIAVAGLGDRLVSGRIITKLVSAAIAHAHRVPRKDEEVVLDLEDLRWAADELLETVDAVEDELCALRSLALTSFAGYLPWVASERLAEPVELLPYVEPLLTEDGRLDPLRLAQRVAELEAPAEHAEVR
jgi:hypothetical protein